MNALRSSEDIAHRIGATLDWLAQEYGLTISLGSPLAKTLGLIETEVTRCQRRGIPMSGELTAAQNRAVFGLDGLCERLHRARESTGMPSQFRRWIRQIGIGVPSLCSPYSDFPRPEGNREAQRRRQASTDIFELVVGLAALQVGSNVRLESRGPQGKPDIRVDVGASPGASPARWLTPRGPSSTSRSWQWPPRRPSRWSSKSRSMAGSCQTGRCLSGYSS